MKKYIYLCDILYIIYMQIKKHIQFYINFINYKGGAAMEYRKLISFGRNSYVLSMPKPWVVKNRLKKGDLISVVDNGNELSISLNNNQSAQAEPKEITINAKNKNIDIIRAEIVSAYLNNYDTVSIFSNNLGNDAVEIKNILRNLTG